MGVGSIVVVVGSIVVVVGALVVVGSNVEGSPRSLDEPQKKTKSMFKISN